MLSNYIKSLIEIHSRVIVPDLGAFMLKGDSSKAIYFNEFLRFNDGLLVDYIADKEQIDKIEAAKKVKLFVDSVNKQLSSNKTVELEGIGTLYLDINEKIQLKTPEASTVPPQVKQPEPEVETSPREVLFELEKSDAEVKPAQATSPTPPPAPPVSTSQPKTTPEPVPVKSEPASKEPTASEVKNKKVVVSKKEEVVDVVPTTTRRMIVVSVFGVLVIAAIVYFAFFRTPKNTNVTHNITIGDSVSKDSTVHKKDSVLKAKISASIAESEKSKGHKLKEKEKIKTTETKNKQVASTVQKSENPKITAKQVEGNKFYLIAGTFSIEANADKMIKKLREEGYTPDKIRNDKKNVFYVSYASFSDKKSAQAEMKKLKDSGKADSWIYSH